MSIEADLKVYTKIDSRWTADLNIKDNKALRRKHDILMTLGSVQFSRSIMSDSLRPHESQNARSPCPSPALGVHSNSCPSSR